MFDGLPHDQLHQFIASSRANSSSSQTSLPLSSFPLHHHHVTTSHSQTTTNTTSTTNFIPNNTSFDSFSHHQLLLPLQHHPHHQPQHDFFHHHPILHHKTIILNKELVPNNNTAEIERDTTIMAEPSGIEDEPWSNEEVLALLRIRSTVESWFPEFTWEHVSRKLAELGFKIRSAEKCKEKFEEENRYFNNINNCTKNFRPFISELEELYNHTQQNTAQNHDNHNNGTIGAQKSQQRVEINPSDLVGEDKRVLEQQVLESAKLTNDENLGETREFSDEKLEQETVITLPPTNINSNAGKKRKRQSLCSSSSSHHRTSLNEKTKFEMFKGFCEEIVNKMMAQQEEMHNKLISDMVKRDQEKVIKEEARKKREMDRMNKELEIMAQEQAIAGDRQATIIEFLRKFTSSVGGTSCDHNSQFSEPKSCGKDSLSIKALVKSSSNNPVLSLTSSSSSSLIQSLPHESPNGTSKNNINTTNSMSNDKVLDVIRHHLNKSTEQNPSSLATTTQNPSSVNPTNSTNTNIHSPLSNVTNKDHHSNQHQDLGKRWPRDEVLALINLRCSLYNNGDHHQQDKEGLNNTTAKAIPLWERISQGMSEMGYKRSAKRCKEKWENINKYFKKTKDANKKRSIDSRTCPYFEQLSTLYNKGTLANHHHHDEDYQKHSSEELLNVNHDIDHRDSSSRVHVGQGERLETTSNNIVVPSAFDFEF